MTILAWIVGIGAFIMATGYLGLVAAFWVVSRLPTAGDYE